MSLSDTPRELWVPMSAEPIVFPQFPRMLDERGSWWLAAVGRLAPGVSIEQGKTGVATVMARITANGARDHDHVSATLVPMRSGMSPNDRGDVVTLSALALAATTLILLIACANVAGMLFGRGVGRRREMGVRLALGASRSRIVCQLLTESLVLATVASLLGLLMSSWTIALLSSRIPLPLDLASGASTVAFALGAAVMATVLFGLVPALQASRGGVADAVKGGSIGFDPRRSRLHGGTVVAQIALSLLLLVMAGMFVVGVDNGKHRDVGFDASNHVLAASFDLALQGLDSSAATTFVNALGRSAAALPGVTSVTFTDNVPMGTRRQMTQVVPVADAANGMRAEARGLDVFYNTIRPEFFATVKIPLLRGRDFSLHDALGDERVAIVSADFASAAWAGADAVGKQIRLGRETTDATVTVIGVAQEAMTYGLGQRSRPTLYLSQLQQPAVRDLTILIRSDGDATTLANAVRSEISALNKNLPVYDVRTLAAYRAMSLSDRLLGASLLAAIGGLALLLASVGVYAAIAFSVGQRTREIGLRVALGAADKQVVRLFVRQGLELTAVGVAIGVALAAGAAKILSASFLGLSAGDTLAFVIVPAVLVLVALLASWIPARRAAAVDPMVALRSD